MEVISTYQMAGTAWKLFWSAGVIGQKAGVENSMGQAQHTVILK